MENTTVSDIQIKLEPEDDYYTYDTIEFPPANMLQISVTVEPMAIPKYECPWCAQRFDELKLYRRHYSHEHSEELRFKCQVCSESFARLEAFVNHRRIKHLELISPCTICRTIILNDELDEHSKEHNWIDKYFCDVCDYRCTNKVAMANHILDNHIVSTCVICAEKFNNRVELKAHECKYKCLECTSNCIHKRFLISFRKQEMSNKTLYKCVLCDYKYTQKYQIIKHSNIHHLKLLRYRCHICGDKFDTKVPLLAHAQSHTELNCLICNDEAEDKLNVLIHVPMCESKILFECDLCGFWFFSKNEAKAHRKKHFTPDFVVCHVCEKALESKGSYFFHSKNYKPQNDLTCHVCLNKMKFIKYDESQKVVKFETKATVNKELIKRREYKCKFCEAFYFNKKSLVEHGKVHTACEICGRIVDTVLYDQHLSTHKDEVTQQNSQEVKKEDTTKFKGDKSCPHCDYTSNFAECLEAHINRFHLKIRPYVCHICNKSFFSKPKVNEHIRTHNVRKKPEQCNICGNKFGGKKALILHKRLHTGEKPYKCDLCDETFLSASRKQAHKVRKHFAPTFQCSLCMKMYYTAPILKKHEETVHSLK